MLSFLPIQKDVFLEIDKFIKSFESFCFFSFSSQVKSGGKENQADPNEISAGGGLFFLKETQNLERSPTCTISAGSWLSPCDSITASPAMAGAGDSTVEAFTAQLWALLFHPGCLPAQTLVDKLNQSEERRWQSRLSLAYWWHSNSSYFILLIRWAFSYI